MAAPSLLPADAVAAAVFLAAVFFFAAAAGDAAGCQRGCDLALASYVLSPHDKLVDVASRFNISDYSIILPYNPSIKDADFIEAGKRISIPFRCDCIGNSSLAGIFLYNATENDTYETIARIKYSNLTAVESLIKAKGNPHRVVEGSIVRVEVSCSCGDESMPSDYTVFMTYPMGANDNIFEVAERFNVSTALMDKLNPGASNSDRIIFVPMKGFSAVNGSSGPPKTWEFSGAAIAGMVVGIVVFVVLLVTCYYVFHYKHRQVGEANVLLPAPTDTAQTGVSSDRSVKFSYGELLQATNNFSLANKIGQGGFGSVFYGELKDKKVAIKKMDMHASQEFLAELKVLANVHHLNLVQLIGYCIENSLFLVYEFIDNGNLSQHLHDSDRESLSWSSRVQIALDSARGLEYIHEHTVPVFIHRDIKSVNILIDKNFHAKVADFGLAKHSEAGSVSALAGTCGYMPPEYARFGDVSQKVDVYAFGVVLYEIISAKEAVIRSNEVDGNSRALVILFEEALSESEPKNSLMKLIDPRLADSHPNIDLVLKMALLARACTSDAPSTRPTMRYVVVELMTLWSATKLWLAADTRIA